MVFHKSIFHRVLFSILVSLALVVFLVECASYLVLRRYQEQLRIEKSNTLSLYADFWANSLESINQEMIAIANSRNNADYIRLCISDDSLRVELAKMRLQDAMDNVADIQKSFRFFVYIPDRNIYVPSSNKFGTYAESLINDQTAKNYVYHTKVTNDQAWDVVESAGSQYLIHVYKIYNGYIGAMVPFEKMSENSTNGRVTLISTELKNTLTADGNMSVSMMLPHTACVLQMELDSTISKSVTSAFPILSFVILLCVSSAVFVMSIYQKRQIFDPLDQLRKAMEAFSAGDMTIRLGNYSKDKEIGTLFSTFDHMAEQIQELKIDVYEEKIQKQKIQNEYLKLQIHPHFYTNMLNLIFGLAEIKNYKAIQELTIYMSNYFRYLLRNKKKFVSLADEMECVKNYIKIQQIRYPNIIRYSVKMVGNLDDILVMPLTIQTFVENSVKHNVTLMDHLDILVDVREKQGFLVTRILDNGMGFTKEILDKIDRNESLEEAGQHIGISNFIERVHLVYGTEAKIQIENMAEGGASVSIIVPEATPESSRQGIENECITDR